MGLAFNIEKTTDDARILESTLLSVVDSAYSGSYDFKEYEWAFHGAIRKACELVKSLESLTDEAYALQRAGKAGDNNA